LKPPTRNSQDWGFGCLFVFSCVDDRDTKNQPPSVFLPSPSQCQPAGVHSCPSSYRDPTYRGGTLTFHCRDGNGVWEVRTAAIGGTWSSTTETISIHLCGDPHCTIREALGEHHQAGHTKGPGPDSTSVFSLCCNYRLVLFTDEVRMEQSKKRTTLFSIQHGHIRLILLEVGP